MTVRIVPMGEAALLVQWSVDEATAGAPLALMTALEHHPPVGLIDLVPAIDTLLVCFDPLATDYTEVIAHVQRLIAHSQSHAVPAGREVTIPVHYGGDAGPDLDSVAEQVGLSPAEVIAIHTATEQRVLMIGFCAGIPRIWAGSHRYCIYHGGQRPVSRCRPVRWQSRPV